MMKKIAALSALLFSLFSFPSCTGAAREDEARLTQEKARAIHGRVLWTEDPAHHAIIAWTATAEGDVHSVYYDTVSRKGDLEAYTFKKEAVKSGKITVRPKDVEEGVPAGHYYHYAELNGLAPATPYYFVMAVDDEVSDEFHFITAPLDDRPISLLSGGDSRLGGEGPHYAGRKPHLDRQNMNRRMSRLLEDNPQIVALAHGGDWCTTGDWRHLYWWLEDHELTVTSQGRVLPLIAARGNHDDSIGFTENFWLGEVTDRLSFGYYFVTRLSSQVALLTLNTEISMAGDQKEWLEEELQELRPENRWLAAQYHRPAFPAVKEYDRHEFARVRQNWVPLFEKYNLDLVMEADGHVLKRTLPIRNEKPDPTGIVYIGEGGLGVPQRSPDTTRWFLQEPGFAAGSHHVWLIDFTEDRIRARAIGMEGQVLDDHTIVSREKPPVKELARASR